MSLILELDIEV